MDPVIRKTEERLEWLSGDENTIRLYEAREHSRLERNSIIATATARGEAKGKAEGEAKAGTQMVLNMLEQGFELAQISSISGMSVEDVLKLGNDSTEGSKES